MSYSEITLQPLNQIIVAERDEPILDAALRAGLNLPHSCKAGHCTSCRARILSGTVRYPRGRPLGLTESEERSGLALLCQAVAESTQIAIEVRSVQSQPTIQVKSLPCRIERLRPVAPDVMAVELRLPANEEFAYVAGQYVDIMLPHGRRRSFSIASAPTSEPFIELHVRRVPNGEFTEQLFGSMHTKTLLRIEGPLGQFWFRSSSPRSAIMIGGGTGYAPLRAMLSDLAARDDRRYLHLYWGGRTTVDLYEHDDLVARTVQHPNFRYTPVISTPDPGWTGRTGFVHAAALADFSRHVDKGLADYDVYASGPPAMVEAIRQEFVERGLPPEQLFFDSFDYAPDTLLKMGDRGTGESGNRSEGTS